MKRYPLFLLVGLALGLAAQPVPAAVSEQEARRLSSDLTPLGGERAGNTEPLSLPLAIPPWRGEGCRAPAADQPLLRIDAGNLAEYEADLPQGVTAMIRRYPDSFYLPVYRSRRTAAAPDWVYRNTAANAVRATLSERGVAGAFGGIPFPIPHGDAGARGRQAMWNHLLRWRGVFMERQSSQLSVRAGGGYRRVSSRQSLYFPYYDERLDAERIGPRYLYYYSRILAPARLAGGAVLMYDTLDPARMPRQSWGYDVGRQRVRRAPEIAYDAVLAGSDGLRTVDDADLFNGALDKYRWRLIYPQPVERFIPYNNDFQIDLEREGESLRRGHLNPARTRWERHRVWVVEGRLREGERHLYSRRRFYIDEDSWQIAVADQYDLSGALWRVSLAYSKCYPQLPAVWTALDAYHDLREGRYHLRFTETGEPGGLVFPETLPDARDFLPSALPDLR